MPSRTSQVLTSISFSIYSPISFTSKHRTLGRATGASVVCANAQGGEPSILQASESVSKIPNI